VNGSWYALQQNAPAGGILWLDRSPMKVTLFGGEFKPLLLPIFRSNYTQVHNDAVAAEIMATMGSTGTKIMARDGLVTKQNGEEIPVSPPCPGHTQLQIKVPDRGGVYNLFTNSCYHYMGYLTKEVASKEALGLIARGFDFTLESIQEVIVFLRQFTDPIQIALIWEWLIQFFVVFEFMLQKVIEIPAVPVFRAWQWLQTKDPKELLNLDLSKLTTMGIESFTPNLSGHMWTWEGEKHEHGESGESVTEHFKVSMPTMPSLSMPELPSIPLVPTIPTRFSWSREAEKKEDGTHEGVVEEIQGVTSGLLGGLHAPSLSFHHRHTA